MGLKELFVNAEWELAMNICYLSAHRPPPYRWRQDAPKPGLMLPLPWWLLGLGRSEAALKRNWCSWGNWGWGEMSLWQSSHGKSASIQLCQECGNLKTHTHTAYSS